MKRTYLNNNFEPETKRFSRYKKQLIKIITKELPGCIIYLFGSRARKDYSQGSDIDLAIDINKKIKNFINK